MKKIYPFLLLTFSLCSCYGPKVAYVGSKNNPTQKIDVFVDEAAIKREYDIVGKGYEKAAPGLANLQYDEEDVLKQAIEKAKEVGADAVFFKETYIFTSGVADINTQAKTDSVFRGTVTTSSTTITPNTGYWHKQILFLKYK